MKIVVTTDSTSDLPRELVEKYNIGITPLIVNLGENEFYDGVNLSIEDIFNFVDKTGVLPKTAARSSVYYQEFFQDFMQKNDADALIHFSISSEFSSSYNNAKAASEEFKNVYVINTASLSSGSGLLVLSCIDKINEGKDVKTILREIEFEVPQVQASFIISNLKYLYKGGRCTAIAVFGANLLMIKPKIKLFKGKMGVDKKYMGKYQSVVLKYVQDLLTDYKNINKKRVFITFTTKDDELNSKIVNLLKQAGFEDIIINFAGATIASHCGENCLGVLFQLNEDLT
jgi:DegV family protein with EDD domain